MLLLVAFLWFDAALSSIPEDEELEE